MQAIAFFVMLMFAVMADGLMEALGMGMFAVVATVILAACCWMVRWR